jgi:hypothetical protein
MYPAFSEGAKARIDDDIRRAAGYRRAAETRRARRAEHRGRLDAVARAVSFALLWPVRR